MERTEDSDSAESLSALRFSIVTSTSRMLGQHFWSPESTAMGHGV